MKIHQKILVFGFYCLLASFSAAKTIQTEKLSLSQYLSLPETDRQQVDELIVKSGHLVLEKKFELYLKYTNSIADKTEPISVNLLKNAIIEVSSSLLPEINLQKKSSQFYEAYYGWSNGNLYGRPALYLTSDYQKIVKGLESIDLSKDKGDSSLIFWMCSAINWDLIHL